MYIFDKKQSGAYLKKLIEKKYASHCLFCRDYLSLTGIEPNDEELRKMSNRLSQIVLGNKALQTFDLLPLSQLLDASCEEILSGGKSFAVTSAHLTNYTVAQSKDKEKWDKYLSDPAQAVLNPDEYNKNILDYALEFKNYALLKYLLKEGYIWFIQEKDSFNNEKADGLFGAGTKIKKRKLGLNENLLNITLEFESEKKKLRQRFIALALEHKDFTVLEALKAREIPTLYRIVRYKLQSVDDQTGCREYYVDELIEAIAQADEYVIDYFSNEFKIKDRNREYTFIYPFLNELIVKLLTCNKRLAELAIRKAIIHNKKVKKELIKIFEQTKETFATLFKPLDISEEAKEKAIIEKSLWGYECHKQDGLLAYIYPCDKDKSGYYCTNIVRAAAESNDPLLKVLIKELNETAATIINFKTQAE